MIQVQIVGREPLSLPQGTTPRQVAQQLQLNSPEVALAPHIKGVTVDWDIPLKEGDLLGFWTFNDPEGKSVFWHTSAHILAQAVLRLWPHAQPTIGPAIEQGFYYDFAHLTISETDFEKINEEMAKIIAENHTTKRELFNTREEALHRFVQNPYKCELIRAIPEGDALTAYQQGEFFDLCRGPHLPSIGKVKAIQVTKTSGAYWRADKNNQMLTRIYGISFPSRKELRAYLDHIEEAKKRDHKLIGPKLDLFSLKEEGPGMPFFHPAGMIMWNNLVRYCHETFRKNGYVEIKTPILLTKELWERSGHWANYRENMFTCEIEEREFAVKPMNCPGGMLFYRTHPHSYRDLPMRVAEIGQVHRYEASGALSGLFRVRTFHQDDAHIFMRPDQIQSEILAAVRLAHEIYTTFGLSYTVALSTRPTKQTIGSDADWEQATAGLKGALDAWGVPYAIQEGDGAFYGPKIDFQIRDSLNRMWQCGTIQLDMALPERFDLEYTAEDGTHKRPVMIHRALLGSLERFFGVLIEHFAGRFPLWISPRQVRILPIADRHVEYAQELYQLLWQKGFHVEVDASHESVSKKVRNAQLDQVNYMITVGDQEVENRTLSLRTRDNVIHHGLSPVSFLQAIEEERETRVMKSSYAKCDKEQPCTASQ